MATPVKPSRKRQDRRKRVREPKGKPAPRKRQPALPSQWRKTVYRFIQSLDKRVTKLERKEKRKRMIGFGAELQGIEVDAPDMDELEELEIT